jgi:predicted DNA-binding WGR domain protein
MAIDAITQCNLSPTFKIRLEHTNGHYKFWEATAYGGDVEIRFGRIGDRGQQIFKDRGYFEKKAPQKINKGYVVKTLVIEADG